MEGSVGTVKRYGWGHSGMLPSNGGNYVEFAELTTLQVKLEKARLGPCCKEPQSCGGECTCEVCAPDLAIQELKHLLADSRAALTAAEQRAKELEEALQGAKWELKRLEGAWWGGAITRPCQETIRIVDTALAQPRTGSQPGDGR